MANIINFSILAVPGMYFYKNSLQHGWEYQFLMMGILAMIIKMSITLSGRGASAFDGWFDESFTLRKKKKPFRPDIRREEAAPHKEGGFF